MKAECDILVIGGGPAGLSAAAYGARAGRDTVLLEAMAPGGQLMNIAEIENYPGREALAGFTLAEEMERQAVEFGATIEYAEATGVSDNGDNTFTVATTDGEIRAKAVIIAAGATHRHLDVPGESGYEGRGVSYCATCDGPFFKGKRVLVVGGGDTALTDAVYLSNICSKVTLVHRRNEFRAQKAVQDKVRARDNIAIKTPRTVKEILGDGSKVTGALLDNGERIECDAVFIFAGITPATGFLGDLVELDKSGFVATDDRMRTSRPGIYAAGDIRTTPFRQVVTAAGDGAIAAHMADERIASL